MKAIFDSTLTVSMPKEALVLSSGDSQVLLASGPGEVESEPTVLTVLPTEEVFARMHQWLTHRSPSYHPSTILPQLHTQMHARKPVSLSYRCPCRFFESHVARANVKHLKILNTPNCALQIVLCVLFPSDPSPSDSYGESASPAPGSGGSHVGGGAKLKNNNRQVCIDPKLKWIQEYLEKALNK
ncbi:hypothetical protein QTO34_006226 [Cnephaeus nilssonii]|uniref:Chemokine interleukin-8-like domain-containing protein n=1 Tax=Cnephaeus nilssonii TaxID=3371016 RepID=A0AA40LJF6_CNENI|nr:hypothetical protein QTO34_006226 [Eptesicus nilssonii]